LLDGLYQSGASKILLPRHAGPGLLGVTLNTAGGVTGGDSFDISARAGRGSRVTMTTQAAERIYRAQPSEVASVTTRLSVEVAARLDWLPQETILFDRCALRRRLTADLATDATLLLVEPLIFGRRAMGEEVTGGFFRDKVEVRRDGKLIFADAIRLDGDMARHLDVPTVAGGARAVASLLYAGPDAERFLAPLREATPITGGVSLIRDGVLFARLLAPDSYLLRRTLIPMIEMLHGASLPRTWTI